MLSNNVSIGKWHVGHLYCWKAGINDCRISSSRVDKGDIFMEVTYTGSRGLPQPRAGTDKSQTSTDWTHSACWHKSYLTKDSPAEETREGLTDPASEEGASKIGVFLWPRKDMTGFKFPAKGNKDSPLPSIQLKNFTFTYQYRVPEHWNWYQLRSECWKEPNCCQNHSPALWWETLLLSKVKDWISLPPPNPKIFTLGVWGPFCLARNYKKFFFSENRNIWGHTVQLNLK